MPAFNEAANIPELVGGRARQCSPRVACELIIVDDGSTDETWGEIECRRRGVTPRSSASACSATSGSIPRSRRASPRARGAVIVTLDADLQNPPEEIPKLVARLGPDCDVASGWRQIRKDSCTRTFPSRLMNLVIARVTGVKLHDYGCMLRAYKREVVEQVQACPEVNKAITALVSWLGVQIVEVPVEHHERVAGRSRYNYWRLIKMNFDLLTGFSTGTLQFVSLERPGDLRPRARQPASSWPSGACPRSGPLGLDDLLRRAALPRRGADGGDRHRRGVRGARLRPGAGAPVLHRRRANRARAWRA